MYSASLLPSMISISHPKRVFTISANSALLEAPRMAEVPITRTVDAPNFRMFISCRERAFSPLSIASGSNFFLCIPPLPILTAIRSSCSTLKFPGAVVSAIKRLQVLVPKSMTAFMICRSAICPTPSRMLFYRTSGFLFCIFFRQPKPSQQM